MMDRHAGTASFQISEPSLYDLSNGSPTPSPLGRSSPLGPLTRARTPLTMALIGPPAAPSAADAVAEMADEETLGLRPLEADPLEEEAAA